jgi:hypothetical protein
MHIRKGISQKNEIYFIIPLGFFEYKIFTILNNFKVEFKKEFTFPDLKSKKTDLYDSILEFKTQLKTTIFELSLMESNISRRLNGLYRYRTTNKG